MAGQAMESPMGYTVDRRHSILLLSCLLCFWASSETRILVEFSSRRNKADSRQCPSRTVVADHPG